MDMDDLDDIDDEMQEGLDELRLLIVLFAGQIWRGASMEERIDPATGPKATFFCIEGRAMWNSLPQPAHDFRLTKLPAPGRNGPCFCGSLRKYKQYCARMQGMPIAPAMMLDGLPGIMPRKLWSSLAGSSINRDTVQHLLFLWQDKGHHGEVAAFALMRRFVEQINPNDNHGFLTRVTAGLLERGQASAAVAIANRYPNDLADMQYSRALALDFAGQEADARDVARFALKEYFKAGEFLLAESPRKPKESGQYGYAAGSDEGAWLHREECRPVWEKLDALAWLARKTR